MRNAPDVDEMRQDLALGLRLAVPRGRAALVRSAVAVVTVAGCVVALLFLAALPGAVGARADREVALTPAPVVDGTAWSLPTPIADGEFFAAQWELGTVNGPVRGTDLFAPDPANTAAPPGVASFPRPGQLWVSPALAVRLADIRDEATVLDGTVVGTIGPDGLLGPDELRFYRGTATPTPPSANGPMMGTTATGWGHQAMDWESRVDDRAQTQMTLLLLGGGVVTVLLSGGLLVLAARLDGHTTTRRIVALRLLGLSDERCRRVGAIRGLALAAAAMILGVAGFWGLRAGAGRLPVGATSFFPTDLTVPWSAAIVIVAAVVGLLMLGAGRPPARTGVDIAEPAPPRPFGAQVIVLLTAAATLAVTASADDLRGRLAIGTMTLAVVAVLGAVAVVVPWLVDVVVDRSTVVGDPRVRRAVSRPFGAAAGLLTAVLVLQATADAVGPGGGALLGSRADLVATAGTAVRAAAVGMLLLAIVGTLLAAERVPRAELTSAVLLPTVLGSALAAPVAVALTWLLAQVTDLRMSALSVPTLAWVAGLVLAAAVLVAPVLVAAVGSGTGCATCWPTPPADPRTVGP